MAAAGRFVRHFSKNTVFVASLLCCVGILVVAVTSGLMPAATKLNLYTLPAVTFIISVIVVGMMVGLMEYKVRHGFIRNYKKVVISAFVVNILALTIVAIALKSYGYTWDTQIIFSQASRYADIGAIDDEFITYFLASSNNVTLLSLLGGLFKLFKAIGITDYLNVAIGLNIIVLSLTQVLIFKCARMLYGVRAALISMIFSFIFISLSLYVQIPYSDTLAIIFPILILFLSLLIIKQEHNTKRLLLSFGIGAATITGYSLKPTVVIATGCIAVAGFLALLGYRTARTHIPIMYVASVLIGVTLGVGAGHFATNSYIDSLKIVPYPIANASEKSLPAVHFMNIGMKTSRGGDVVYYGGYSDQTIRQVIELPTKEERVDYSVNSMKRQLKDYGFLGYIDFLALKLNWITSDGTFYAYGEGSNAQVFFPNMDPLSVGVRSFMAYDGKFYGYFANVIQIFWIGILLLIGVQVYIFFVSKSSRYNIYLFAPRMMIVAILLFILAFEGRSRYLYLYIPIFIIVGLYTVTWLRSALQAPKIIHDSHTEVKPAVKPLRSGRS